MRITWTRGVRERRIAAIHAGSCRKDECESDINEVVNER
jgi:hypothetical protein